MTAVLPVLAIWITKCFCLCKLRKTWNSSLDKLLLFLLLLELSKEQNPVSKIFDLTALVGRIDKLVLLISQNKS